jgi:hypothetical protein
MSNSAPGGTVDLDDGDDELALRLQADEVREERQVF